jgi:hypothetical protein
MKRLQSLGRVLSKDEQKQFSGGCPDCGSGSVRTGYCLSPGVGCWHYDSPVNYSTCQADIAIYCTTGGSCLTTPDCPH